MDIIDDIESFIEKIIDIPNNLINNILHKTATKIDHHYRRTKKK